MLKLKNQLLFAAAVTLAVSLGGCTAAPGSDATGNSASSEAAKLFNTADVNFAQMMLPHHQQAVEMSDTLLAKADVSQSIRDLATQIKAAQAPEIVTLKGWLKTWNAKETMSGMNNGNDGMMSDAEMKTLTDSSGSDGGKIFLTQMIAHHRGAIVMAQTETTDGKSADAKEMAQGIVTSQTNEISVMQGLLTTP